MILSGANEYLGHSRDTLRRDPILKNKSIFRCDDSRKRRLACNKWRPPEDVSLDVAIAAV